MAFEHIFAFWFSFLLLINSFLSHSPSSSSQAFLTIPLTKMNHFQKYPQAQNAMTYVSIFPNDNDYAVFLWVGSPIQIILVRIDLGSHFVWSQCEPCNNKCYPQNRPLFDLNASNTLQILACDSDACRIPQMQDIFEVNNSNHSSSLSSCSCQYSLKLYNDYAQSAGRVVSDTLTLPRSNRILKNFVMGCSQYYEGPFNRNFSGVLGLGRGPLSLQAQLGAQAFSLCLVYPTSDIPSVLSFYDFPPSKQDYENGSIMVLMGHSDTYPHHYVVQFVGIGIDGFMLDIQSWVWGYGLNFQGGVVIDTKSSVMRLPSEAYRIFGEEIKRRMSNFTHMLGPEGLEFCYKDEPVMVYPEFEYYFQNGDIEGLNFVTLKLTAKQTRIWVDDEVFCLAFTEGKGSALTVIGNTQLQGTLVTFDLKNDILVFTQGKC